MRLAVVFFLISVCFSCKQPLKEDQDTEIQQESEFQLYEMSAMAALMEQMFVDNQRIGAKIKEGIAIADSMPSLHQYLFTAEMTDPSDKDLFFDVQAREFIRLEEEFYANPNENSKEKFNAIINSCLSCHQKKCGGPIPRIKKLLIP